MKMILAIVPDKWIGNLIDLCLEKNIQFTRVASSGGFLKEGNTTVILAIKEERLEEVKGIFSKISEEIEEETERLHVFYMAGDVGREY